MDKAIVKVSRQQQKNIGVHLRGGETFKGRVVYEDDKMFALNCDGKYQCIYFGSVEHFEISSKEVFEQVCDAAKKDRDARQTHGFFKDK